MIESFHSAVESRLGASHALATTITSYALDTQNEFPFVTLPNFAIRGSAFRISADAMGVHWVPLVTEAKRQAWEAYAEANRFQIDEAFLEDAKLRKKQDEEFGLFVDDRRSRKFQDTQERTKRSLTTGRGFILEYGEMEQWVRKEMNQEEVDPIFRSGREGECSSLRYWSGMRKVLHSNLHVINGAKQKTHGLQQITQRSISSAAKNQPGCHGPC